MKPFVHQDFPTVGIEQEYHLIDPQSGDARPCVDAVLGTLDDDLRQRVSYELYTTVLESQSQVCRTIEELEADVTDTRRRLARACEKVGSRLTAAGSHPFADWRNMPIVNNAHYKWVCEQCQYIARRMLAFGLHVHVGMRSVDHAMYVMNEMRRWLYPLAALAANSPYYEGVLTGLQSTRLHLFGAMPRSHMPPYFETFDALERFYEKLAAAGDVTAPGDLWWMIRPQPPLGTVEVRALDLPTETWRVCALAAVCQAAMAVYQDRFEAGAEPAVLNDAYLEQNRFQAMRFALDGKLIEPESGEVVSMRRYLERLFEMIEDKCEQFGSSEYLAMARRMMKEGPESQWQVRRCEELGGYLRALELDIAARTVT
ncbi:MAG TPA: YbdK family carboxylate-amine ligase [Phycisphaerales bacterium]|nr:YbdK family carboxylate-amine ligase [Phycisphaerales bacterium]